MRMLDEARGHVICTLVNKEHYKAMLGTVPHRRFKGDTVILYRVISQVKDGNYKTFIVDDYLMDLLEYKSRDELHEAALGNTKRLMGEKTCSLGEGVYAISNDHRLLGATAILYTQRLHTLAEAMGCDLYIVPSSVHEMLILPAEEVAADYLRKTVRDANLSVLAEDDILSNEVFIYRRATGSIEVA